MGAFEILCITIGVILGSGLYLRNSTNENGVIFGAVVGAFSGLGISIAVRQILYRFTGYRKAKDEKRD